MKVSRAISAIAAASVLLLFSGKLTADVSSTVYAEDISEISQFSESVPDSYSSALQFFNRHGGTFIQDGLLYVTFLKIYSPAIPENAYRIDISGQAMEEIHHDLYKAFTDSQYFTDLEVYVFKPVCPGSFSTSLISTSEKELNYRGDSIYTPSYEFSVDDELNISETDFYAELPDCMTEFKDYYTENGIISTVGDKLVFCLSNSAMRFSEWKEGLCSENMRKVSEWDCTAKTIGQNMPFGGEPTIMKVIVYEAVSEGAVDVRWDVVDVYHPDSIPYYSIAASYEDTSFTKTSLSKGDARIRVSDYSTGEPVLLDSDTGFAIHWRSSVTDNTTLIAHLTSNPCMIPGLCSSIADKLMVTADALGFKLVTPERYAIPKKGNTSANADDHVTITIVNEEAYDIEYRVITKSSGDVNGDGEFNTADLVTLQKWLLGKPDAVLKDWKSGDLWSDNVLDVHDLCLMRNTLIEAQREEDITLFILDSLRPYSSMNGIENIHTITTIEKSELSGLDEILSLTEKISNNIEQYKDMKLENLSYSTADYSEDELYLAYRREGEEPDRILLCRYGENFSCLNDKDIKELVILLIDNGFFSNQKAAEILKGTM